MKILDTLRKENGYTYYHIAKMINCSKSYVWQIFNGKRTLSYEQAVLISSIFNMKTDEIFYLEFTNEKMQQKIKEMKKRKQEIDKKY